MSDQAFEYKGYRVEVDVREAGNESASGVFLSTITIRPDLPEGNGGDFIRIERNAAHIYFSEDAADEAASVRARKFIDSQTI